MKISRLFLLIIFVFFSITGFAQRLTFSMHDVTLDTVLQDIQRRTGYLYFVDMECVRVAGRLSFSVRNATVAEAMDSCLGELPVYFRLIRRTINVYPGSVVWGQVVDERGEPVAGATIMAADGDPVSATVTGETGRFRLRLLGRDRPLVVSCVGYGSRQYRPSGARELQVLLSRQTGELQGVVVSNGFEEVPAERATGSFARVGRELIGRRPAANILDRMDGVTSSLLINKNVQAGTNQSAVTIRGRGTIFSNPDPLVIVDNFPYSGDINNINPEDIESVTILKDAAAASVWGTRAANGVIVLKTKQGAYKGVPRLSFTSSLTVGRKPDLYYRPVLSSSDYIGVETFLFGQGWYDNTILSQNHYALSPVVEILLRQREGQLSGSDTAALLGQLRGQDTRRDLGRYWYRQSVNQQYWLGLSGGTANNRYALSAGLDQDEAGLRRNAYRRVTVTGSQAYLVVPHKLELNTSVAFAAGSTYLNNTGGIYAVYPYLRLADAGGKALAVPYQLRTDYADTVGGGRLLDWHYRPLDELRSANNVIRLTDWRLNAGLHYTMGKGWLLRALYQYGQGSSDQQELQSLQTYYTRNLINQFTQPGPSGQFNYPVPVGGILDETLGSYQSHNGRLQVEYHPTMGADHDLHLLAGSELQDVESRIKINRTYGYNPASQTGLPVSSYKTLYPQYASGSPASIPYSDNNVSASDHYWSYYCNGGYQYRQRYTVTASARLDQSNLFGVDINHKTVPLWSAGLAWEASREDFYRIGWLPLLRLRVTDGYNGNVYKAVSGYTTTNVFPLSTAGITHGFLNTYSAPYAAITNPPNPHLRWEQVHVINAGLDFAGKDSLVQGSLEYYTKTGQYLIGPASLDPTSGNVQYTANVAHMVTRGIDLSLRIQLRMGPLGWNSVALFNYVRDKVTRYLVQPPTIQTFLNTQSINPLVGRPLYSLYALGWAGLDPQSGSPRGWLNGHPSQDYTSLIGAADFHTLLYQGPVNPPFFGSWRNDFTWRQWGLSVNIVYKFGHYFARPSIQYAPLFYGTSQGHPDYVRRWQYPGDELHTDVPSMIYPANPTRDDFYSRTTVLVEKGDLIRLQDVQLYYDLTRKTLPKLPIRTLRVYGYANNIGLLWTANRRGIDPDALTGMPDPRTIAVGIKMEL
ncbi:SusC/RagA family TonB-linked outer membrane protein [Flavitalea sp. BT771]|uniref:SusC/RagA family TonB-linked outer membrane protein n=1 Tax=Flavitalea sp. BT771 TaxID=3063329 RepID=UPI0026E40D8F|nr:SusC/RagA family TonB-linked outer membrane protein [Flavitalea sp. BT771]MDO6433315.1 SusC/RagA family TonB-linked outer membrane protein [Flavitalea sp. BT771]